MPGLQMPTGTAAQSVYNPDTGQQQLPSLSTNPLDLSNTAGAPNAGTASSMTSDPSASFGQSLTDMLVKYQQLGTHAAAQLGTGALNYSDAGLAASNAQLTNPSLQGYAPSTIMNAGSSAQQPFNTGAQGLQQQGQTFNEQLSNFGNALTSAKDYLQKVQDDENKKRDDARAVINQILTSTDPNSIKGLGQDELSQLEKLSGYPKGFLTSAVTYKQQQLANAKQDTQVVEVGKQKVLINSQTGATIKVLGAASSGSGGGGSAGGGSGSLTSKQVSRVKAIIAANPGEYGHAADQIDAEFGAGTATKADTLLKSAYMIPSDAINIVNQYGTPPDLAAWNSGRQQFINSHSYNSAAAAAAYDKYVKKPSTTKTGIKIGG